MHRVVLNFRCLVRFLSYQVKHSRLHQDMIQSAASKTITRTWVHRFTEVSWKQGQQQTNFGIIFLPQSGWIIVQKSILQRLRPKVLVAHVQASTPFVEGGIKKFVKGPSDLKHHLHDAPVRVIHPRNPVKRQAVITIDDEEKPGRRRHETKWVQDPLRARKGCATIRYN